MEQKKLIQKFTSPEGNSISVHHSERETILYSDMDTIRETFTISLTHDEMLGELTQLRQGVQQAKRRHKNNLKKRDQNRNSTCRGCRHNYYNFAKDNDSVGVEVREDYYCWHVERISRGKCSIHSPSYR